MKFKERFQLVASAIKGRAITMPVSEWREQFPLGGTSISGVGVNATSAQKFSAVFACVRIYSELPASMKIDVTSTKSGKIENISDGEVYQLLHYPNKYMNRFSFIELMGARLQLYGNAVAVIKFDKKGTPVELIPVEWTSVNIKMVKGEPFYIINDRDSDISGTFFYWEVVHFKINTRNGYTGMSPLSVARESVGLGLAAEGFGGAFFGKGGNLKAAIETDNHMDDKQFKEWKTRWDKFYTGAGSEHTTPILEYGMKYKLLGIPQNDAQFLETRVHQVQDVARFFLMPPSIIGENTNSTFKNNEQQDLQFVKYSLRALLKSQEVELEYKLVPKGDHGSIHIKYNMDSLLRGDMLTRARFGQIMVQSGTYTRNEIREIENKPPLDGLDKPLEPAFLTGKLTDNDSSKENNDDKD